MKQRWRRWILGLCLGLLAGWFAGAYAAAFLFVHPARHAAERTPAALGLRFEDVAFRSTDGLRLRGWFVPGRPGRGTVILCHGYPGNRGDLLSYLAFLHRAGLNVLAFDFRSLGQSEGAVCTIGYREVGDALGAVAFLRARRDTRDLPIGMLGVSMGGAVALQATARSPEVCAVVADSPYARLDRAVNQRFRRLGGASGVLLGAPVRWIGENMIGVNTATVSPVRGIAQISPRPVFLIYGSEDRWILPEDSRLLYDAARAPKTLWRIAGAGHVGGHSAARGEYERRVVRFFDDAFALTPGSAGLTPGFASSATPFPAAKGAGGLGWVRAGSDSTIFGKETHSRRKR